MSAAHHQDTAEDAKYCCGCRMTKRLEHFHCNRSKPDGRQTYCKVCQNQRVRDSKQGSSDDEEEHASSTSAAPFAAHASSTSLYVMYNDRLPCEYKVGRSKCVELRRNDLQNSHNFAMVLIATFPDAGWAEGLVHDRLAHARVRSGSGREWFAVPLGDILLAIGRALEQRAH